MFRFDMNNKIILAAVCCVLALGIISSAPLAVAAQQDFNGREMLAVARVAMGGEDYSGLQFLTAKSKL